MCSKPHAYPPSMSSTCASVVDQLPPHRKHIHIPCSGMEHTFFDILQSEDVYFLDVIIWLPPDSQTSIAAWTAFQEWLFCHGTKQSHYIQLNCHGNFVTQNTVINFAFISLLKCHKRPFKNIISLKKEPFAFDFERG